MSVVLVLLKILPGQTIAAPLVKLEIEPHIEAL